MDKEIIRQSLAKMRQHLEAKGIIKPIRKEPELSEEKKVLDNQMNAVIDNVKLQSNPVISLEEIEQNSFSRENFTEKDLGF